MIAGSGVIVSPFTVWIGERSDQTRPATTQGEKGFLANKNEGFGSKKAVKGTIGLGPIGFKLPSYEETCSADYIYFFA